jgi:hypothetical protein
MTSQTDTPSRARRRVGILAWPRISLASTVRRLRDRVLRRADAREAARPGEDERRHAELLARLAEISARQDAIDGLAAELKAGLSRVEGDISGISARLAKIGTSFARGL